MIYETFTKRMEKEKNESIDIYIYYDIPEKLRIQILHIWDEVIGNNYKIWNMINTILSKELGKISLDDINDNVYRKCKSFLLQSYWSYTLDIIELSFVIMEGLKGTYGYNNKEIDEAIEELNFRFKENKVGYEFNDGKIIRIDNQFIHNETILPTLKLLYDEKFQGANDEFLKAHEHLRNGKYKEAIAEALKSFESTMKIICEKKQYTYNKDKDTSSRLLEILFDNKLIPEYLKNHFTGIRTTLEAGLPTLRNRTSGHGQGENIIEIPEYLASYAINLTATNIVFLINSYKQTLKQEE